jgi:predicted nucleic acid-binding protein
VNVFLDTSVILRLLFSEPAPLREWQKIERAFASRLLPIELSRTIDRERLGGRIDDGEVVALHQEARRILRSITIVMPTEEVFASAEAPMPTVLGTLDTLHLVSAMSARRESKVADLTVATHDAQLAAAARASGFAVIGS